MSCCVSPNFDIHTYTSGKFFQTLYTTTMTEYKALLHMWHKGTCGGPGLDIYFESWSKEKEEKYNVDTNTYNHSNVAGRPAILIENYSQDTVKKPYLTVIHMWDNKLQTFYHPSTIHLKTRKDKLECHCKVMMKAMIRTTILPLIRHQALCHVEKKIE